MPLVGRIDMQHENASTPAEVYDVVVIGGAMSGAATACLLLQRDPGLRLLIVERSSVFGRRVGEATVEVSGYYLTHVLGLSQHLNDHHYLKQGLRFWFANNRAQTLDQCSEIGGRYLSRVPAFLVDRAVLDQEVLRRACEAGAILWRPAVVQKIELCSGGWQTLSIRRDDHTHTVQARWVVDASGVAATLARQNGWWTANTDHPTTAVWSRWRGVKDLDGTELAGKYPCWAKMCYGLRNTATNHLMGDGWWAWIIPLKGGDVSIGVTFDQRFVEWPADGTLGQRLKDFLCRHPVGRELLVDAEWQENDLHWRKNLPYVSSTFAGDGFVLVGDAAGFIDPFYSPGLDWMGYTTYCASHLILEQRRGQPVQPMVDKHNQSFAQCYRRWFEALYQDKYQYLGEFGLMRLAFLMDLGFYYLGVAAQPYKNGPGSFLEPVFSQSVSTPFFYFMRTYNRRLASMAAVRRRRLKLGAENQGRRFLFGGFTFSHSSLIPVAKGILAWLWLELTEGWRSWFVKAAAPERMPKPAQVAVRAS